MEGVFTPREHVLLCPTHGFRTAFSGRRTCGRECAVFFCNHLGENVALRGRHVKHKVCETADTVQPLASCDLEPLTFANVNARFVCNKRQDTFACSETAVFDPIIARFNWLLRHDSSTMFSRAIIASMVSLPHQPPPCPSNVRVFRNITTPSTRFVTSLVVFFGLQSLMPPGNVLDESGDSLLLLCMRSDSKMSSTASTSLHWVYPSSSYTLPTRKEAPRTCQYGRLAVLPTQCADRSPFVATLCYGSEIIQNSMMTGPDPRRTRPIRLHSLTPTLARSSHSLLHRPL